MQVKDTISVEILRKINEIRTQISSNLPNIYLVHGELKDEEMNQLNNDPKVKAFISFTKGEGYGRPLAEAAITGKPIYVAQMPPVKNNIRFQKFFEMFKKLNIIKDLDDKLEDWKYEKLNETDRISGYIKSKIKNYDIS